jgi:hypothetical protein
MNPPTGQSGSGGGNASGSGCQTRKALPAGSAMTACQAVRGVAVLPLRTAPPSRSTGFESRVERVDLDEVHPTRLRKGRSSRDSAGRERRGPGVDGDPPVVHARGGLDAPAEKLTIEGRERLGVFAVDLKIAKPPAQDAPSQASYLPMNSIVSCSAAGFTRNIPV